MSVFPIESVKTSHDVVELLADQGKIGVTEVATALDVPKSTAHDHLRTLEQTGYVVNVDGAYRLSLQFLYFGEVARNDHDLFIHGRGEAFDLSKAVGETNSVQLVTEENGRCAVLVTTRWQQANLPPQAARTYPTHVHLHTNAPGKAILASMNPATVERVLENHGLPGRTPDTITDAGELRSEMEQIREEEYAVDEGELITGMTGVAAPIVTDDIHGAIAVYGATEGFGTDPRDSRFVDAVRESADEVEANLIFARH
jgi:DNA-binding IclR family transcriptional regulator